MQFGGTTKYVATKFTVGSGSDQKLAMLRKFPEVSCSDLRPLEPWCHGVSHGVRVGIVVSCLGMALKHIQGRYPNPNNDNPTHIYPTIRNSPHGRWKVVVELGGWRRVCGSG